MTLARGIWVGWQLWQGGGRLREFGWAFSPRIRAKSTGCGLRQQIEPARGCSKSCPVGYLEWMQENRRLRENISCRKMNCLQHRRFRQVFPSWGFWGTVHTKQLQPLPAPPYEKPAYDSACSTVDMLRHLPLPLPLLWPCWAQKSRPAHWERRDAPQRKDKGPSSVTRLQRTPVAEVLNAHSASWTETVLN